MEVLFMEKKYQIFISSTYEDLKEERRKVQDTILEMYQFPIGMEMFSAADEEQWEIIQETIDSSDYYVLIIGHRYGSVIENGEYAGISYTQKEFRYALEKKIPILAFLIDDSVRITPDKMEQDVNKKEKLEASKNEVMTGRIVQWWTSKEDLANKVMNSLNKQIHKRKRPGWIRTDAINIEETQNELVEMNKKIRKLEAENEELKKSIIERKPRFSFKINGGVPLKYNFNDININRFKAELLPLTIDDIKNYEITLEEMEEYNNSIPKAEEMENYLRECRFYECVKKNAIPFLVSYANNGNCKGNDVHIHIKFSEGLIIMKSEDVENISEPEKPKTLENPINRCLKKRMGMATLEKLYSSFPYKSILDDVKIPLMESSRYSISFQEDIEDNSLTIWNKSIMHTEAELTDKYYLIPSGKGKYKIIISVICEELAEQDVQVFDLVIEN